MPENFSSEQEMAALVIKYLEHNGYEVWQEVQLYTTGPIADIVAKKGEELLIIECKRSFGYRLISDAMNWLGHADRVIIVYPQRKFGDKRTDRAAQFMLDLYCIEEWRVRNVSFIPASVFPKPQKTQKYLHYKDQVLETLRDEHKEWAKAGSVHGRRVTDFQITCYHLEEFVKNNSGCTLKEAVPKIAHHYASDNSAYGSLDGMIRAGNVRGVRGEGYGRAMKLYPDSHA